MDPYKITFETYGKVAQVYNDKFMDMDLYNDTYDQFCTLIARPGARILELACGPGNITRYLATKRPDFNIEATDIVPQMLELAKANVPAARFRLMDCREIDQLPPGFDGIICGFGLPYLSKDDVAKLIRDCAFLLNNEGVLYFSFVPGDDSQSGYQTGGGNTIYFHYHQEDHLKALLEMHQFELVETKKVDYPGKEGSTQVHAIFIARKTNKRTKP